MGSLCCKSEDSEEKPQVPRSALDVKIVLLGDAGVGKTQIWDQFLNNRFTEAYEGTIGGEQGTKEVQIADLAYTVTVVDTGGRDTLDKQKIQCKGVHAFMLVYDAKDEHTLSHLEVLLRQLKDNPSFENVATIIVANKCDIVEAAARTIEEGRRFALRERGTFFCVSAKSRKGIDEMFHYVIEKCRVK